MVIKRIIPLHLKVKSFNVTLNVFQTLERVFNGLTLEDNLESIKAAIAALEEFSVLSSRPGNYINLTLTANTTDETANNIVLYSVMRMLR